KRIVQIIKELIRKTRALTDQERVHFQISFCSVCGGCSPSFFFFQANNFLVTVLCPNIDLC
ncbi:hypothetical protein FRX31_035189, partial [Thalictrum thalictroides]